MTAVAVATATTPRAQAESKAGKQAFGSDDRDLEAIWDTRVVQAQDTVYTDEGVKIVDRFSPQSRKKRVVRGGATQDKQKPAVSRPTAQSTIIDDEFD